MILDLHTAKKLEPLLGHEVHEAIQLMLDELLRQKLSILQNPESSETALRIYQAQYILLNELKDYRQRIIDGVEVGRTANYSS